MPPKLLLLLLILCAGAAAISGTAYFKTRQVTANISVSPFSPKKSAAVFAAYSADGTVPDYVVSYLKKLKQIAPNIVYITDNPIRRRDIAKLTPYANRIIAARHGEYDWGSYKRGFAALKAENALNGAPFLIFANDSALLVAPSLKPLKEAAEGSGADFYAITANEDGAYHLQSYFMLFSPAVYSHPGFSAYLNAVKAEKNGLAVAYRYEVPFTAYLQNLGFAADTFIPYESLAHLPLNDKNCYPLALLSQHNGPFLKMRAFTERLNVQEPRRLVFNWLKKNAPAPYRDLIAHLKRIKSPYLREAR